MLAQPRPPIFANRLAVSLAATALLLIGGTAAAAPPDGPDEIAGDLEHDLDGEPFGEDNPVDPVPHLNHTLHVEFGGGSNNGRQTAGSCNGTQTQPFPDAGKAASILQEVQSQWAEFDMSVMDSVPGGGTYTTILIGQNSCCGALGVAPVICGTSNLNAVAHVCQTSPGVNTLATAVSQEAAHTYGLMHVSDEGEIMNPYANGGSQIFKDACYSYNPSYCSGQKVHCGGNQQNSVQELLAIFGAAVPDTQAPTVSITYPADGENFPEGADFNITADAADDKQVLAVELIVDGMAMGADNQEPYSWGVNGIPAGTYELMAVASDLAGNNTDSAVVTITVGGGGAPTGGTSSGSASDSGGSTGVTTSDSGTTSDDSGDDSGVYTTTTASSSGGELPPGFGQGDEGGEGCACATGRGPAGALGWLLMLPVFVRRRRS